MRSALGKLVSKQHKSRAIYHDGSPDIKDKSTNSMIEDATPVTIRVVFDRGDVGDAADKNGCDKTGTFVYQRYLKTRDDDPRTIEAILALTQSNVRDFIPLRELQQFLLVHELLQPVITIRTVDAAAALLQMRPDEFTMKDVRLIIDFVFDFADGVPYNHPSHYKLARMLKDMEELDKDYARSSYKVNNRSPPDQLGWPILYRDQLFEQVLGQGGSPWDEPDEPEPITWVNRHAFLAILEAMYDTCSRAIGIMLHCFERRDQITNWDQSREYWLLGAAQYIIWSGQGLYRMAPGARGR